MDDPGYLLAVTLIAATMTWALRALPFALLAPLRNSKLLPHLAERIPVGMMVILTVYTLRHVNVIDPSSVIPAALGVLVTTVLHLWKATCSSASPAAPPATHYWSPPYSAQPDPRPRTRGTGGSRWTRFTPAGEGYPAEPVGRKSCRTRVLPFGKGYS
jgi:branched-subunit amino acid transport protein AzlD